MTQKKQMTNPLGTDRISTLVARFAVSSIIATLVSAVYNIADQLFIGNAVGTLGNAATNVALLYRQLHHYAALTRISFTAYHRTVFKSAVSALWFPGRCTPTGRAICPRHSGRFSISDLNHRKRSPDPCGRQPENGNVCHGFRCCH